MCVNGIVEAGSKLFSSIKSSRNMHRGGNIRTNKIVFKRNGTIVWFSPLTSCDTTWQTHMLREKAHVSKAYVYCRCVVNRFYLHFSSSERNGNEEWDQLCRTMTKKQLGNVLEQDFANHRMQRHKCCH